MLFQHFDWDLTHQVLFLYILPSHHMNLRDQPWKMLILWCRTDICSCKFSAKVSLMLDNPFLVPSLCKLIHISLCFIQIAQNHLQNCLFPSGKAMFFWSHPQCFGPLGKFQHNIKISVKPLFPDYLFLWLWFGSSLLSNNTEKDIEIYFF